MTRQTMYANVLQQLQHAVERQTLVLVVFASVAPLMLAAFREKPVAPVLVNVARQLAALGLQLDRTATPQIMYVNAPPRLPLVVEQQIRVQVVFASVDLMTPAAFLAKLVNRDLVNAALLLHVQDKRQALIVMLLIMSVNAQSQLQPAVEPLILVQVVFASVAQMMLAAYQVRHVALVRVNVAPLPVALD